MPEVVGQFCIERRFGGKLRQRPGKLFEVGFGFKAFGQFSSQRFEFISVHNLPVSVVGMSISKTGNYTILITVSSLCNICLCLKKYHPCSFANIKGNFMRKYMSALALVMLMTGCAQQTFTIEKKPVTQPKEIITHHFFISGIGQEKTVDAATICNGAENVVKTETQKTFVNELLGVVTLGIYTPMEARVYCAK